MNSGAAVVGAGLAGCEAAWQLALCGVDVTLYDMKPDEKSPAHKTNGFAELVCSNSLRADRLQNAVGLLKEEMRRLDSLIMKAADATRVPAGGALAVDRTLFSEYITNAVNSNSHITVVHERIDTLPQPPCVIATGPLTADALAADIAERFGGGLYFFDAAAPIVSKESLDMDKIYAASRYGRGGDDYLNCPFDRDGYFAFVDALINAQTAEVHGFEEDRVFEGCMPVEVMAKRGPMTLAFGPLKPRGLRDPRTGKSPFAVVQLRQDDAEGRLYNIVGFQTHLKFGEQKRVFSMIPGLEHAEFERFGVMHRNTFLRSGVLDTGFRAKNCGELYFAGQMTGVEGYVESAASGLLAGLTLAHRLKGVEAPAFSANTATGAMASYVSHYCGGDFQPMNISFGLIPPLDKRVRDKQQRYDMISARALAEIDEIAGRIQNIRSND